MSLEVRRVQCLSEEDRQKLFGWGKDPFGVVAFELSWRPKDWHLVACAGGEPVAHVGLLAHQVLAGGRPVAVAGVGGVLTVPAYRNRGLAQRLLREAIPFMAGELGAEFGLLFCLPPLVPFYERLGWRRLEGPVRVEQPQGEIDFPAASMVLPLSGRAWPPGEVRTRSLPW